MRPRNHLSPLMVWRQLTCNLIAVTKADADIKTFFTVLSETKELPKEDLAPGTFATLNNQTPIPKTQMMRISITQRWEREVHISCQVLFWPRILA